MGQFKESERVSVIIPTYNGKHLLKECLSSLYELDYPAKQFEIKLVDNNSTDGTAQYVRRHFRKVEVLRNPENNYCKANNLGIAHSRAPFLAFLNNDTAVDRYWLRALVDSMYQDKRIGCVGSKVIFPDGRIQSAGHYEFPNFRWGDRGLREPDIGQYALSEEVGSLSGSSVLFRRFCLDDVGNFDEDFIMYLEDVDIFLRCRQKAWKLLYVPTSVVRHAFHGTAEEKHVHFYIERNRLLLIAKHFPRELSRALETKEHSLTYEELYRILPDIFLKLFFLHKDDVLKPVLSEFCLSLQRVYNFSKDQAVQELNKMLRNARQDVETVERDNVIFGDRAAKLESGMRAAVAQAEEFSKEVKKVTGESAAEKSALADRIAQIETALAEKKSAFAETQASFLAMQARAEGMQVEIAHRDAAAQDLLLQRNELQQQLSSRSQELEQRSRETELLRSELGALQQKVELLQVEVGRSGEANKELVRQREEVQEQLSRRSVELEERRREVEELRIEMKELQERVEQLQVESGRRQEAYEGLSCQRNELQQQLSSRSQELEQRSREAELLRSELGALQQKVELLQVEVGRSGEANKELVRQREEVQEQLSRRSVELEERRREVEELRIEMKELQERVEQLQVESGRRQEANEGLIHQRDELQQQIENILHSRTYRYLAIPLWGIADAFKHFLIAKNKKNILVIKPYYVSTEQAEESLKAMQSLYKDAKITLFAHVFFPDYQRLKLNNLVDEKILFCPGTHALTFLRLIKTVFCLNSRYFDQTILLSGMPIYQGYRKAKILAFIIGGKRISVYDTLERKFKPLLRRNSFSKLNNELTLLWGAVSFWFVVLFFLLFIVLPLKLKSLFRK